MSVDKHSKAETGETSCLIFSLRSVSFCSLVFGTRIFALGSGSSSSPCIRLRLILPFFLETGREARSIFCPEFISQNSKVLAETRLSRPCDLRHSQANVPPCRANSPGHSSSASGRACGLRGQCPTPKSTSFPGQETKATFARPGFIHWLGFSRGHLYHVCEAISLHCSLRPHDSFFGGIDAAFYGTFVYDFGEHDHVFRPVSSIILLACVFPDRFPLGACMVR